MTACDRCNCLAIQRYTHVAQVLQELIQGLGLYAIPASTGATYHYGQMHLNPPPLAQFPPNPKLDYFRRNLVEGWLAAYNTLPVSYLDIENYIKGATKTLMGVDQVRYIWTFKRSPTQSTKYAL